MIIYIASFPRSGSSWLRRLVLRQFGVMPSSVHAGGWERMKARFPEWRLGEPVPREGEPLSRWLARCEPPDPPGAAPRSLLLPGCGAALTEENRRVLAASPEPFVLKTHEPPFERWLDGELVVQPVRHAGAALWSYERFLAATEPPERRLPLRALIAGGGAYGSWSDYHAAWERAHPALGPRLLRVRFEDLAGSEARFCEAFERHTGIAWLRRPFESFAELHAERPLMFRQGSADAWRRAIGDDDARLLFARHGAMLGHLGYEPEHLPETGTGQAPRSPSRAADSPTSGR